MTRKGANITVACSSSFKGSRGNHRNSPERLEKRNAEMREFRRNYPVR